MTSRDSEPTPTPLTTLPAAMTGMASPAKAALGDKPAIPGFGGKKR